MELDTAIYVSYVIWYSFGVFVTCTIIVQIVKTLKSQ